RPRSNQRRGGRSSTAIRRVARGRVRRQIGSLARLRTSITEQDPHAGRRICRRIEPYRAPWFDASGEQARYPPLHERPVQPGDVAGRQHQPTVDQTGAEILEPLLRSNRATLVEPWSLRDGSDTRAEALPDVRLDLRNGVDVEGLSGRRGIREHGLALARHDQYIRLRKIAQIGVVGLIGPPGMNMPAVAYRLPQRLGRGLPGAAAGDDEERASCRPHGPGRLFSELPRR